MSVRRPRFAWIGLARASALWLARVVAQQPRVRWILRTVLDRFPIVQTRLYGLIHHNNLPPRRFHAPQDVNDLSPATQASYRDLGRHFEVRKP